MKWRCDWCGKPQEKNDPPCDNCGHHKFERAVVPMGPESTDAARTPEWVCTECGRHHQKHSPPCSRCGNDTLRKDTGQSQAFEDVGSTGWLDVFSLRYAVGYAIAGVFVVTLVLGIAGVITLPGTADGSPTVEDVPGNATTVNGLDIATVESLYVERLNDRRGAAGYERLDADSRLTTLASVYNKREVKRDYADGSGLTRDEADAIADDVCQESYDGAGFTFTTAELTDAHPEPFRNESTLATALVTAAVGNGSFSELDQGIAGVDIHAVDGEIYLAQFSC